MKLAEIAKGILENKKSFYDLKWDNLFDKFSGTKAELQHKWNSMKNVDTPLGKMYYIMIGNMLVGYVNDVGFACRIHRFSPTYPQTLKTTEGPADSQLVDAVYSVSKPIFDKLYKQGQKKYKTQDSEVIFGTD